MAQKVDFDGTNRQIVIKQGFDSIDVQIDLYSDWKEWFKSLDNSKFAHTFRTFGGDETSPSQFAPKYFFLVNGWKLYAENINTSIQTNLYSDDSPDVVVNINSAVSIRNSDVPIIKDELEQRLDYGDRIYFDVNTSYSTSDYPNGTIAQPVNNIWAAIELAQKYNIYNIYALSDLDLTGITGETFDAWQLFAARENLTITIYDNVLTNMLIDGFAVDIDFNSGKNKLQNCKIINALNLSGEIKNSQMAGTVSIYESLVIANCYSGIPGSGAPIYDMRIGVDTYLSIRAYSGGVDMRNCDTSFSRSTIELIAGQVIFDSSCSDGYIDLRGVGYKTDNSTGTTIKTLGFIDSFEEFKEEQEINAYGNKVFIDTTNGAPGSEYPVGTAALPSNNLLDTFTISNRTNIKNIHVRTSLNMGGIFFTVDDFNAISDTPNVPLIVPDGTHIYNVHLQGFKVEEADFKGREHTFSNCIIQNVNNLAGHLKDCDLDGSEFGSPLINYEINVFGNTSFVDCHPRHAGEAPTINLTNPNGTTCAFRDWNGDIILNSMTHVDDILNLETSGSKIIIGPDCTAGTIDLRGVGYIVDNSNGVTLITTGFINSFEEYQTEQEINAYNNRLYIDTVTGVPGTTYPIGTAALPSNNLSDIVTLSENLKIKTLHIRDLSGNPGLTGDVEDFIVIADTPYLPISIISGVFLTNLNFNGFSLNTSDFVGFEHSFNNCILQQIENLAGHVMNCQLDGGEIGSPSNYEINVFGNTTFIDCYPRHADEAPTINLTNPNGTTCALRGWNGSLTIGEMIHAEDKVIIETYGAEITISENCTAGLIIIRGIGTVINNSLGTTVNIVAFVNSFEEYAAEQGVITKGDVISSTINTITIDGGASTFDGAYDPAKISIISGAGYGQTRGILEYTGSTKTAVVDRNWKELPDSTSRFIIFGDTGREHVNEGLSQSGSLNTITLNPLASSIDNTYAGQVIFIRSGFGDDQSRRIIAYDGATKIATVHKNWDVIPNNTSGYVVLPTATIEGDFLSGAIWDAQLSEHTDTGSAGDALGNVSAGASPALIADAVWDEPLAEHTLTGSAGNAIEKLLGLSQHNYRLFNQQYDSNNLLTASTIKLYRTALDCETDTGSFAQYSMTATYDSNGLLTNYQVVDG